MAGRVLVTGGGKRVGAAIARRLAADGWQVAVHYGTSGAEAEALAAEIGGVAVPGDLADPTIGAWLLADAEAALGGPLTGLVNSASLFEYDSPSIDPALLAKLMQVNLATPVALAADLAARATGDAAVVNLLDQKVGNLNPDYFSYTCTKIALEGATTMMAQAFAPRVRVNAVSPGLTLKSGDQSDAEFEQVARANLLQRPVGVERIADAVAWLLGAEAVTGQNIFVDMGQRFLKRDGDVMFDTVKAAVTAGRYTTILDGLEVTMGLGIHEVELAAPQRVMLTVWLTCEYGPARFDDAIGKVVDYDFIRDGIRSLVAGRHFQLQETLCEEVAALCFADPRVREVRVRSMKPDIYPDASVGCEIVRHAV